MKRSVINRAYRDAAACFARHHWHLPPAPRWDITDFGLGDFNQFGLTLVNLAEEPECCEKLMYARRAQTTPWHSHAKKKEDIICRAGELTVEVSPHKPGQLGPSPGTFPLKVNGAPTSLQPGSRLILAAGSRITLPPGVWHTFHPSSEECIIGEVSTVNDDVADNLFLDPNIGRFPGVEEDEPAAIRLLSDRR